MPYPLAGWQRFAITFVIAAVILALRRPDHLLHPSVWDEDGVVVLPDFLDHGWRSVFWPLSGYLNVPSRALTAVAASISFAHYAIVAIILSLVAQSACLAAVAWAPTALPLPIVCALLPVLIPTDPEVLLTPLYLFWWTGLLLFPALVWRGDAPLLPRIVFIALAGLSSPLIASESLLFVCRAAMERTRGNITAALTALGFAALQYSFMGASIAALPAPSKQNAAALVEKFFGLPLLIFSSDTRYLLVCGCVLLSVLLLGLVVLPKPERHGYLLIGLALAIAVVTSVARVNPSALDPIVAGPRYFFYPAILTLWMLVWLMAKADRRMASVAGILLAGMMLILSRTFVRHSDPLPWDSQAAACAAAPGSYTMEVQFDGRREAAWKHDFNASSCRAAIARQLF